MPGLLHRERPARDGARLVASLPPALRGAALMPAVALLVHQLRYELAYGGHASHALAAQGRAYLSWLRAGTAAGEALAALTPLRWRSLLLRRRSRGQPELQIRRRHDRTADRRAECSDPRPRRRARGRRQERQRCHGPRHGRQAV
jgi:hypothetical protein